MFCLCGSHSTVSILSSGSPWTSTYKLFSIPDSRTIWLSSRRTWSLCKCKIVQGRGLAVPLPGRLALFLLCSTLASSSWLIVLLVLFCDLEPDTGPGSIHHLLIHHWINKETMIISHVPGVAEMWWIKQWRRRTVPAFTELTSFSHRKMTPGK